MTWISCQMAAAPSSAPAETKSKSSTATTTTNNYANKFLSIKKEISDLKALLTTVVEQFKEAIASLTATPRSSANEMDTDTEASMDPKANNQHPSDFTDLIQDLKYEIATIVTELRALFKQQLLLTSNHKCSPSSVT